MADIRTKEKPTPAEQGDIVLVRRMLADSPLVLYHGTKDPALVPSFSFSNPRNDYGKGFYTTPDAELGKEWAYSVYSHGEQGYLYTYRLDTDGLNILNLVELDSLHWIAELLANRTVNTDGREALRDTIDLFLARYKLDTDGYDVIIGYRADDSYFAYAEDFVTGAIYRSTLDSALRNGNLGIQVFVKSRKAFGRLVCQGEAQKVPLSYSMRYRKRDAAARDRYRQDRNTQSAGRTKETIYHFLQEGGD